MRLRNFVFAVLPLAVVLTACSDPTDPHPPDTGGNEPPPSSAFVAPQPGAAAVLTWMA